MKRWMIYGANGYTGRLIAAAAAAKGMQPILAGRDAASLRSIAESSNLETRVFALDHPSAIARELEGVDLVLNCAGPFSRTCAPLLESCLSRQIHYLDITGEIDVFAHCHRADAEARARGVVVLPGTGFDVVPTDCVAAMLKQQLPDASHLVLGFEASGGPSPGTARTGVEGLAKGGRARIDGEVRRVPLAWKSRTFVREDGTQRSAMTIPWGDVYTAYVSTGIPNIETYMAMPAKTISRMRWLRYLQPLFAIGAVQTAMQNRALQTAGPDETLRQRTGCTVWGEARNARGDRVSLMLKAPNGYALTVTTSLGIVEHLLSSKPAGGYYTPSMLMGEKYVLSLPNVHLVS
jgi:short subunit dehydrogenase-like uncharacterized protein